MDVIFVSNTELQPALDQLFLPRLTKTVCIAYALRQHGP